MAMMTPTSSLVGAGPVHIRIGTLEVDLEAREARVDGAVVATTPREFDLLGFLAAHPRVAFSREVLLREVWQSDAHCQQPSTVTEHVYRLRQKFAGAAA